VELRQLLQNFNKRYEPKGEFFHLYDNFAQISAPRKSAIIPGYAGYIPRLRVNNHHVGKTITEQSREVFDAKVIDTPINNLSSTGFNHALIPKTDDQLHATSRRYGLSTNYRTAANM